VPRALSHAGRAASKGGLSQRGRRQIAALVLDRNDDVARSVDVAPHATAHLRVLLVDGMTAAGVAHDGDTARKRKREVPGRRDVRSGCNR
jgi:hypothetical protein